MEIGETSTRILSFAAGAGGAALKEALINGYLTYIINKEDGRDAVEIALNNNLVLLTLLRYHEMLIIDDTDMVIGDIAFENNNKQTYNDLRQCVEELEQHTLIRVIKSCLFIAAGFFLASTQEQIHPAMRFTLIGYCATRGFINLKTAHDLSEISRLGRDLYSKKDTKPLDY